jgi:hypothetical protein
MTNGILFLSLLTVLVGGTILWDCRRSRRLFCVRLPRPFRDRQSQVTTWTQAHSDEDREKADALLTILCEAFSFDPDERYQFAPTDRIMDVYRACYPRWLFWRIADAMEIESLMMDLSTRFHLDDDELSEMTLGEIVTLMEPIPKTTQEN